MSGDHNMNCSANDPCQELREFQESQNGVFSIHNACCYRNDCKIAWEQFEKLSWEKAVSEMNNEPVAWMAKVGDGYHFYYGEKKSSDIEYEPLYTAPRELSDEEIEHIYTKICLEDRNQITTRFARAILKKASEK